MKSMKHGALLLVTAFATAGCQTIPADALKLQEDALEIRQTQTRRYEGVNEKDLLAASAGVLQDLGFTIEESETKLGILVGSKDRDATNAGQVVAAIFLAALTGVATPIDSNQKIRVALISRPALDDKGNARKGIYLVRVTFQRMIWDTQGRVTRAEGLNDEDLYTGFFDKLSKSVFLEGQKI